VVIVVALKGEVWIEPGKEASQGKAYRELAEGKTAEGSVALVLGAGNQVISLNLIHHHHLIHHLTYQPGMPSVSKEGCGTAVFSPTWNEPQCSRVTLANTNPVVQISVLLMDVMHMLVAKNAVVICKSNPVLDYLGPYIE
jgi:hypothetical protein